MRSSIRLHRAPSASAAQSPAGDLSTPLPHSRWDLASCSWLAKSGEVRSVAQTSAPKIKRAGPDRSASLDDRLNRCSCYLVRVNKGLDQPAATPQAAVVGLTTDTHMLCDPNSRPLRLLLSGGQASDISYAQSLLDDVCIPAIKRCRPRK